jgi:hypothetical protein
LRSIPEGTLFNIVGFGTRFEKLFNQSQEYNETSLQTAVNYVNKLAANFGGTDILGPLTSILAETPKEGKYK